MKRIILLVLFIMVVSTGCTKATEQHNEHEQHHLAYTLGSNDWTVITSLTDSAATLEAYQFAVEHPEVLDYMPCYCGCYEEDGHTSNTHCLVDSVQGNEALLDTMGISWGVCVDIAREAKYEFEKGTELLEIREMIDEKYKSIGIPSTPTPLPEEA